MYSQKLKQEQDDQIRDLTAYIKELDDEIYDLSKKAERLKMLQRKHWKRSTLSRWDKL